jgi:hypothetical protein
MSARVGEKMYASQENVIIVTGPDLFIVLSKITSVAVDKLEEQYSHGSTQPFSFILFHYVPYVNAPGIISMFLLMF